MAFLDRYTCFATYSTELPGMRSRYVSHEWRVSKNGVHELLIPSRDGTSIEFYPDVPEILNEIRRTFVDTKTATPNDVDQWTRAREALSLITVPSSNSPNHRVVTADSEKSLTSTLLRPAEVFFDEMEIYPGSKIKHFKAIHNRTGIPYTEMVSEIH
ncbi:hypothetical protein Clacol_008688 [Clathrus columnatus]|uniref:Vitellogenin n=1 Tax=Clathrus columnatus TaxID=1419009 RepID=A0AAV5AP21_9AGAM|nr:hypothetical protein Clacol_008688 [Clathrus columnatus]